MTPLRLACVAGTVSWLACVVIMHAWPAVLRDWDSVLYARMAGQLAELPLSSWLHPAWPEGYFKAGPFLEHPAGALWPAALAGKFGAEPHLAMVSTHLLAMLLIALLLALLAREAFGPGADTWAALAWMLSPVFIQFMLRGRQEPWLVVGLLLALRGAGGGPRDTWAVAVGVAVAALSKGLLALVGVPLVAGWAFARGGPRAAVRTVIFATGSVLGVACAYEAAYRATVDASFLAAYGGIQLGYTAHHQQTEGTALRYLLNPPYYLSAVLLWSLPASLLLVRLPGWMRAQRGTPAFRVVVTLLGGVAVYVLFFSAFGKRGARYVVPAYALLPLLAAAILPRGWASMHARILVGGALAALPLLLVVRLWVDARWPWWPPAAGWFAQ